MKAKRQNPPRVFTAGVIAPVEIRHVLSLALEVDELVTLTTPSGGEIDILRKDWGFYATPSTNDRLLRFGLRTCLAEGADGKRFVLLVEHGREAAFFAYLEAQRMRVVDWLDGQPAPDQV